MTKGEQEPTPGAEAKAEAGAEPQGIAAEQEPQLRPRIYVASLSDYNAGRLHGIWLDADEDPDDLHLRIRHMLAQSKQPHAEEWAIHDFEDFNGLHLGEWEDLNYVSRVAKGIREHGAAFADWATLVSEEEALDTFGEAYLGRWPSLTEYAQNVLEDLGLDEVVEQAVPENLRPYVKLDAEAFGRDLQLGGDVTVIESGSGVYVFASR